MESTEAASLLEAGDPAGARELYAETLRALPDARGVRPLLLLGLAECLWALEQISPTRACLVKAASALEASGLAPSEAREWTALIFGLRVEVDLVCGLPDQAAIASEVEAGAAADLDDFMRIVSVLHRVNVALALQEFDEVVRLVDAHHVAAAAVEPAAAAALLVRRGIARSEIARAELLRAGRASEIGDTAVAREAEATLRSALANPALAPGEARSVRHVLTDLALRRGDLTAAGAELEALAGASVAPLGGSAERGLRTAGRMAIEGALRARLVLALGRPAAEVHEARASLVSDFEAWCGAWEREVPDGHGMGFLHWGTLRDVLSALIRLESALDPSFAGSERALEHVLRAQALGGFSRGLGAAGIRVDDVQAEVLNDGSGIVVLLPAMSRTHVFVLDADGVDQAEGAARDRILAGTQNRLLPRLLRPPGQDADRASRPADIALMARVLAEDVVPARLRERIASWTEVRVVGAELCGEVPFELLPVAHGEELGLALPVSYLPSLPAAVALARRPLRARALARGDAHSIDLVIVADPRIDPELARLYPRIGPLTLHDSDRRRLEGGTGLRSLWLSQDGATPEALAGALLREPQMLLMLVHGIHDSTRILPPGLALARGASGDGALWSEDVRGLRAPSFVALLSCGTALGNVRLGDDAVAHLGGAFLAAGADCALISRGSVALDPAVETGVELVTRVCGQGASPSHAMLAARRALVENPDTRDPFYRSLVSLVGLSRAGPPVASPAVRPAERSTPAGWSPLAWIAIVALVVALAALAARLIRRRRGSRARGRAAAARPKPESPEAGSYGGGA